MTSRSVFSVGADVGGTWVRAQAVDEAGNPLKLFKAPALPQEKLADFFRELWTSWGISRPDFLTVGSKGVWTPPERRSLQRRLAPLAKKICVISDIELAFESALTPRNRPPGQSQGIIVVAGTGSIALGRDAAGHLARAGGFGPHIGDEGSGFWIGKEYLRLLSASGTKRAWVQSLVRSQDSVARIAALANGVLKMAPRQKPCAQIVSRAHAHLAALVLEVADKLSFGKEIPLSWSGGLFSHSRFRLQFLKALSGLDRARKFIPVTPRRPPALAAAQWGIGGQIQGLPPAFLTKR